MSVVAVYDWVQYGNSEGLGTKVEFDYWMEQGALPGYVLGEVIAYEPASEDAKRMKVWAKNG